mmetsp:Transcript_20499/g.56898  ORF Transcript_20499/g.56898 Transcript_20499/m.56898 type:complete len:258 (+) Transcript_20499:952-1725(+)
MNTATMQQDTSMNHWTKRCASKAMLLQLANNRQPTTMKMHAARYQRNECKLLKEFRRARRKMYMTSIAVIPARNNACRSRRMKIFLHILFLWNQRLNEISMSSVKFTLPGRKEQLAPMVVSWRSPNSLSTSSNFPACLRGKLCVISLVSMCNKPDTRGVFIAARRDEERLDRDPTDRKERPLLIVAVCPIDKALPDALLSKMYAVTSPFPFISIGPRHLATAHSGSSVFVSSPNCTSPGTPFCIIRAAVLIVSPNNR